MKKFLALVMAVAMMLSLAGCGTGKDAKTIYDEASKKTSDLKDMDATATASMTITQGDQSMDLSTSMDILITDVNTADMKYLSTGKTTMSGQDYDTSMYYENGYYYLESMGKKVKYPMDLDQLMKQIKQSTGGSSVDSSFMKKISAKKDGDNQHLTFSVDADKMDTYVQDIISGLSGTAAVMKDVTYKIKEASGEAVVNKDGYFSSMDIKLNMDMEVQGQTVGMEIDTNTVYNNPGQAVTVTAPDLDGYQEVDPSAVEGQK